MEGGDLVHRSGRPVAGRDHATLTALNAPPGVAMARGRLANHGYVPTGAEPGRRQSCTSSARRLR